MKTANSRKAIPENRVRLYRRAAGLTQKELARRSGISRVTISRVESSNGTYGLCLHNIIALLKTLDVPFEEVWPYKD